MTCACEMHELPSARHGITDNDAMQTHTSRVCGHTVLDCERAS